MIPLNLTNHAGLQINVQGSRYMLSVARFAEEGVVAVIRSSGQLGVANQTTRLNSYQNHLGIYRKFYFKRQKDKNILN